MTDRPIIGVSAIVFDDAGRVLLVQRARPPSEGLWSVPGGKLERGETIAQGIAREVREETGLLVTVGSRIEILERISPTHHYVIHAHVAHLTGGTLTPSDEVHDARWVTDDELASLSTTNGLADVIAQARRVKG